jgi:selenocysteine-specific elongation factor
VLERAIAAAVGDRFILRHPSGQRTIGGGRFIDLRAPARKRRTPERLGQLTACAFEDPAESLAMLLGRAPYFVDFSAFARDRALADGESERLARELALVQIAVPVGVTAVSELTSKRATENLLAALAAFHADNPDLPGLGMERLRLQLEPRLPAPAFAVAAPRRRLPVPAPARAGCGCASVGVGNRRSAAHEAHRPNGQSRRNRTRSFLFA